MISVNIFKKSICFNSFRRKVTDYGEFVGLNLYDFIFTPTFNIRDSLSVELQSFFIFY